MVELATDLAGGSKIKEITVFEFKLCILLRFRMYLNYCYTMLEGRKLKEITILWGLQSQIALTYDVDIMVPKITLLEVGKKEKEHDVFCLPQANQRWKSGRTCTL